MFDEYAPSAGTIGTITNIDDAGTIHVKWETGSSLGLIPSIDVFEVIRYPQKASAHIHSLDGKMDEITILKELGNNSYLVDYRGVKCSAIFNPFNCTYYADDISDHAYVFYSLREAIQQFRREYRLQRKHIRVIKLY